MRISYQLMQSGKVVLSDPRSTPVMTNQWASPSANVEHVIPDRKPIYINLTKSITNQLDLPGEKLHSFLLGSSITSELRRLLCYRKCLTRKSNIETPETSEKTANGLNGFSGDNHSPLRTSIGRGGNVSSMRATSCEEDGDLDTSTLYPVVSTITKPLHLHRRSESEGPGYCNGEASVQFTIIGGTRTSIFRQDLSDSTPDPYVKTSPRLSVTTSNSPLNDIYDQTGPCVQSANVRSRVVSIPYDPDHESLGGLNKKCGSMCVIGSRPGSSLPMTKTKVNFAQVTDPETTRSARMDVKSPTFRHSPEKRPYSATGENNEGLKVEEERRSVRQVHSARSSRELKSTVLMKNLFVAGQTALLSPKRPISATTLWQPRQRSPDKMTPVSAVRTEPVRPSTGSVIHIPTITMTDEDDSTTDPAGPTGNDSPVRLSSDDDPR